MCLSSSASLGFSSELCDAFADGFPVNWRDAIVEDVQRRIEAQQKMYHMVKVRKTHRTATHKHTDI